MLRYGRDVYTYVYNMYTIDSGLKWEHLSQPKKRKAKHI